MVIACKPHSRSYIVPSDLKNSLRHFNHVWLEPKFQLSKYLAQVASTPRSLAAPAKGSSLSHIVASTGCLIGPSVQLSHNAIACLSTPMHS